MENLKTVIDGGSTLVRGINLIETRLAFTGRRLQKSSNINRIIIHHTATRDVHTSVHHKNHFNLGWGGVGYHYIIRSNGDIEIGRPEYLIGVHTRGHNLNSIGVAISGNLQRTDMTERQFESLILLCHDIGTRYKIAEIRKHNDFSRTLCPGKLFPWDKFLSRMGITWQT